jgi:serine phosphatase RsbU (regulator of sigma subunit)
MKIIKCLTLFLLFTVLNLAYVHAQANEFLYDSLAVKISDKKIQFKKITSPDKANEKIALLKSIGSDYYRINQLDSAIYYFQLGARQALRSKNKELYSSLKYNLSLVYLNRGMYKEALDAALFSLETDQALGNMDHILSSLNSVALIYQEWGMYDKALDYRLQSIKLSEDINNSLELANGYFNLGSLYIKIGKYVKALNYLKLAEENYQLLLETNQTDSQLKKSLSECIYSTGLIHVYKQEYQKALMLFNEALRIKNNLLDFVGEGNCYYQIGLIHFLDNDFEEARQNYFLSLQYKNRVDDLKGIALVYFRMGELYFVWSKYHESATFLHKSIVGAQQINDHELLKESYKVLYKLYSKQNKYQQALKSHEYFKMYSDSCLDKNMTNVVEELSIKYESEKKEKENNILIGENKLKALTIQKQKSKELYMLVMIVLILFIVVVLAILYRSKRKTNNLISYKNRLLGKQNIRIAEQKQEIEKKNLRMTDSILYAKRIQQAMLADVNELNKLLDDAFIYFKPKDIVSGDFYWFAKVDQKLVLAAVDCTGHGVPGAFMSMLGNSFLNQIVIHQKISSPHKILEALSKEVEFALNQEETKNRDGMDMSLCTIDLQAKLVDFSGAKNPLIVIRNGVTQRIKGDRKNIGRNLYKDKEFDNHQIEITSPTCFYMFSDGYADQFGGVKGRKFLIKRLQDLLGDIYHKPMNEQKQILHSTMEEWMKDEDQVDDILIVGFKIE